MDHRQIHKTLGYKNKFVLATVSFFLDKMASYHLNLGDSRISKLYSTQDVRIQFMAKKWSSKLSDLGRVKDMSDLLHHLERMRNQRCGGVMSSRKSLDGRPGMRNVGLHWFEFFLKSTIRN